MRRHWLELLSAHKKCTALRECTKSQGKPSLGFLTLPSFEVEAFWLSHQKVQKATRNTETRRGHMQPLLGTYARPRCSGPWLTRKILRRRTSCPALPRKKKKSPDAQAHSVLLSWSSQDSQASELTGRGDIVSYGLWIHHMKNTCLVRSQTEQRPVRLTESWRWSRPQTHWGISTVVKQLEPPNHYSLIDSLKSPGCAPTARRSGMTCRCSAPVLLRFFFNEGRTVYDEWLVHFVNSFLNGEIPQ